MKYLPVNKLPWIWYTQQFYPIKDFSLWPNTEKLLAKIHCSLCIWEFRFEFEIEFGYGVRLSWELNSSASTTIFIIVSLNPGTRVFTEMKFEIVTGLGVVSKQNFIKVLIHLVYQAWDAVFARITRWNPEKKVENATRSGVFLTSFEVFHLVMKLYVRAPNENIV